MIVNQGSQQTEYKYNVAFADVVAILCEGGDDFEHNRIQLEFCRPMALWRRLGGGGQWIKCKELQHTNVSKACHCSMDFSNISEYDQVLQGLDAMGPTGATEYLKSVAMDKTCTQNSPAMTARRAASAERNGDNLSLFCSPAFVGSTLHKRLTHRRKMYVKTEAPRRMLIGPPRPADGTHLLFPITCSACLVPCDHCQHQHELVLYPDPTGSCKYVTTDGVDHTECPTLLLDPLKSPSPHKVSLYIKYMHTLIHTHKRLMSAYPRMHAW